MVLLNFTKKILMHKHSNDSNHIPNWNNDITPLIFWKDWYGQTTFSHEVSYGAKMMLDLIIQLCCITDYHGQSICKCKRRRKLHGIQGQCCVPTKPVLGWLGCTIRQPHTNIASLVLVDHHTSNSQA